jgi:hypothetical protein
VRAFWRVVGADSASVLAHEISVMIFATGLGTLMTLNLVLGVLRRLYFVRELLSLSDG